MCDWRHYVSQWRSLRGEPVEFGEIPLAPGELLPVGALDDEKPDEQRLMEASGNEGASFERSYHRAALVLWRRERYAEVLLQAGVAAALPYLKEQIEACAAKTMRRPPRARKPWRCARLLRKRLAERRPSMPAISSPPGRTKRDGMLRLLAQLGDAALLEEFIAEVVTRDYDGSDNAALAASARLLDAEKMAALMAELMRRHTRHWHGHCVALLGALASSGKPSAKSNWHAALRQTAEAIVGKLDEVGKKQRENEWMDWRLTEQARPVNAALVTGLLEVWANWTRPHCALRRRRSLRRVRTCSIP